MSRKLADRLPLRNLNWQSASRPLRQIRQLHLDFVPDKATQTVLRPPVQRFDSNGPTSLEIVRSGHVNGTSGGKERRHQIPGLKTSPYLKLYVLRCDDADAYKSTDRSAIREWIRENAQSKERRAESHDAFEWLILHVVVPDTVAASEPRWRESSTEPDELKERKKSGMKFPGKSTKTVFDRLRADFNESSKTGQDRVAQIKLSKGEVPPDLLPTPAVAETLVETPQERELAWKDLMDKLKTLILGPFDRRVRQYEADIAEQESRRSLPGWNFCTFFIHKEGLARALESIGLVEDALAIYDELSLGLETVVRDVVTGQAEGTATTFASYTDDIQARILGKASSVPGTHDNGESSEAGSLFRKDYRERIVRSDISIFDFFCYLFRRQKALILRLANTRGARAELGANNAGKDGGEDLVLASEVCWRASSFIHNTARALRDDLWTSRSYSSEQSLSADDIDTLVCAWTYQAAEEVLSATALPVLDLAQSDSTALPNGPNHGRKRSEFVFAMGASPYPQRASSLAIRKSAPELQRAASVAVGSFEEDPTDAGTEVAAKSAGIPGLPELANYRAELVMMQRQMVDQLGARKGWRAGWASLRRFEEVSLDDDQGADKGASAGTANGAVEAGRRSLLPESLASALESEDAFDSTYERLSQKAMRYYAMATQTKSVNGLIGDIAMIQRRAGKVQEAEQLLKHILPSYEETSWSTTEVEIMTVYMECLKQLDMRQEYVTAGLKLLAQLAGRCMAKRRPGMFASKDGVLDGIDIPTDHLFADVVDASRDAQMPTTLDLEKYFSDLTVDRAITLLEGRDGFGLRVSFTHLLGGSIEIERLKLRFTSVQDPNQEIILVKDEPTPVAVGPIDTVLRGSVTAFGAFAADTVTMSAGTLNFVHRFKPMEQPTLKINDDEVAKGAAPERSRPQPPVIIAYPNESGFDLNVDVVRDIHIDKPRIVELQLSSGWNDIADITLKAKPLSAGLRLHLADAEVQQIGKGASDSKPGHITLGSLGVHSAATVRIPYTVEHSPAEISIRFEILYRTPNGECTFLHSAVLRHHLPLDVDVDDVFRLGSLFSTFTVRTTRSPPLIIRHASLESSPCYEVRGPPGDFEAVMVAERHPAQLLYTISRKETGPKVRRHEATLALTLQYIPSSEVLSTMLCDSFAEALQSSRFRSLSRLLCRFLATRAQELLQDGKLGVAIMLDRVPAPSYEHIGWQDALVALPATSRAELSEWLRSWHGRLAGLPLDYTSAAAAKAARRVTLPVEVPTIDMVFRASLALHAGDGHARPALQLGAPVSGTLKVRQSDMWSAHAVFGEPARRGEYVLEVQADDGEWVCGGPRRTRIRPDAAGQMSVALTLIPVQAGTLALPTCEVQPAARVDEDGQTHDDGAGAPTCSTSHDGTGRRVEVVRGTPTTRARVLDSQTGPAREAAGATTAPG